MKTLTIDRDRWRRGGIRRNHTHGPTYLLNDEGYMCCLGFDALACGVTPYEMRGAYGPGEVTTMSDEYRETRWRSGVVLDAMEVNDNPNLSELERETKLIPLLKAIGGYDDVQFINGLAPAHD